MSMYDLKWYRYSKIKPPANDEYLVTCRGAIRSTILYYKDEEWFDKKGKKYDVLAWMFLPGVYRIEER